MSRPGLLFLARFVTAEEQENDFLFHNCALILTFKHYLILILFPRLVQKCSPVPKLSRLFLLAALPGGAVNADGVHLTPADIPGIHKGRLFASQVLKNQTQSAVCRSHYQVCRSENKVCFVHLKFHP